MSDSTHNTTNPLIDLLENQLEGMGRAQKAVAEYLLANPSEAVGLSLEELAKETNTSRTTVLRFCRELGLSGYKELQQLLMQTMLRGVPLSDGDPILQWSFIAANEAVSETLSLLDMTEFSRAVECLAKARFIVWYGLGDSATLAQSGQHKCWVMGMDAKSFIEPSSFVTSRMAVGDGDVLVVISQSGEGDYIVKPVEMALLHKVPVIAIVSNKLSWLASHATVTLYSATRKVFHEYGLITVRAGQEAVMNSLILKVAQKRGIPFDWRPQAGKGEWPKRDLE